MEKLLKTLTRTVVLNGYVNTYNYKLLSKILEVYKDMLIEMLNYALEYNASQSTLHKVFYRKFREKYPWLPTRIIKGCYRDAVRRAKSFRELKKRGKTYTDKPVVKNVTITLSDSQDWRVNNGSIYIRVDNRWVEVKYRNHKLLHKYLAEGWRLAEELRLKLHGRRVKLYLTFKKHVEVSYNPRNVVAVDVNENNVTLALFENSVLRDIYMVETGIGKLVIAYSERRRRISEGRSTKDRDVRKKFRKLREVERKLDVIRKAVKFVEKVALENNALVVVGNVFKGKRKLVKNARNSKLRHRIHQWSVSKLVELLDQTPLHVVEISEAYTSSVDPYTGSRVKDYKPLVIRFAVRGLKRVKVHKHVLRIGMVNKRVVERDVVGAINIGLKYLSSDGRLMALASTGAHEVWVKLMNPHRSSTPLAEVQIFTNTLKYR